MERQIATTSEQSQRLLRCGVSADTADMSIRTITEPMIRDVAEWETPLLLTMPYGSAKDIYRGDYVEPAWSLSALLGLLPKRIKRGGWSDYTLNVSCDGCFWDLEYTYARYCGEDDSLVLFEDADPIEVCVKAIEWLTENNYKLNEQ